MNKPKVALITPSLGMGGAERWIVTLARFFKRLDPYLILNLSGQSDSILLEEIPTSTKVLSNFYPNPKKIIDVLSDADAVISWCFNLHVSLKDNLKCPTIDVSHSDPSWDNHKLLISQTHKNSKYHVGVSKVAASAFKKKDATVIYNGIDTNRLKESKGRIEQRKKWGCENSKVVIFLSRLSEEKNPKILIDCSEFFDESWKFLFVNTGSMKNYFNSIKKNNVKMLEKTKHIGDYYSGADVVVLPSDIEGMPLVLLESWFCGVPVVTTRYNSYLELENMHGELCLSTEVRPTALEFSNKINQAFYEGRCSKRVILAKDVVEKNYTYETMIKNWEDYVFLKMKECNDTQ
jgi:glycosyltransferase involved in cell wall biosynthesis